MPRHIKDEYELIEEIGAGGMATVHKAVQKSLNRQVAIKQLKKAYHSDSQIVKRFERESQVAASLQHENIVHIYDYWKKPDHSIVMEYVDGINLAEIIAKAGALPVDIGIMIAVQVCSALDYAHMRGLIHRDIKPGNIMIKRNGEVKLMDFGIAHTRELESLTLPGTLIGTPAYMSPEQIVGGEIDLRSDVFSFGIVLYELFTGVKPFNDDETRAVSAQIVNDSFISPRRINGDLPRSVQRVIRKCLNKKPHKRFSSMLEVEKRLGKRLAGKTTKAASLRRISEYLVSLNVIDPLPEQETLVVTSNPPRRARLRMSFAALLLLAMSAAGLYYFQPGPLGYIPAPAAQSPVVLPRPAAPPLPAPVSAPAAATPELVSSPAPSAPEASPPPAGPSKAIASLPAPAASVKSTSAEPKKKSVSLEEKKKGVGKKKKKQAGTHQ